MGFYHTHTHTHTRKHTHTHTHTHKHTHTHTYMYIYIYILPEGKSKNIVKLKLVNILSSVRSISFATFETLYMIVYFYKQQSDSRRNCFLTPQWTNWNNYLCLSQIYVGVQNLNLRYPLCNGNCDVVLLLISHIANKGPLCQFVLWFRYCLPLVCVTDFQKHGILLWEFCLRGLKYNDCIPCRSVRRPQTTKKEVSRVGY